ncbi:MAG: Uma2 family endonuclease, partial [Kofleriaceae bacterium]
PFYARIGVREVWLVDPATRVVEIFALQAGGYAAVTDHRSVVLGVRLETVDAPKLRIHDGDAFTDV